MEAPAQSLPPGVSAALKGRSAAQAGHAGLDAATGLAWVHQGSQLLLWRHAQGDLAEVHTCSLPYPITARPIVALTPGQVLNFSAVFPLLEVGAYRLGLNIQK